MNQMGRELMLAWVRRSSIAVPSDLSSWEGWNELGAMVGDAEVVALTEAVHGATEPLEFRNRAFQYLVKKKGFTAIAIESGLAESRLPHDYVRGRAVGDLEVVVRDGIGWTFDRYPQNRALLEWLRSYNGNSSHGRKVNFYGFDVPGSPGSGEVRLSTDTACRHALRYLRSVDPTAAAEFHARLDPLLPDMRLDCDRATGLGSYNNLSLADRDALTAAIADLISLFARCEHRYVTISGSEDYNWAHRVAIGARQADLWLRECPRGWKAEYGSRLLSSDESRAFSTSLDVRDCAQADNLAWILEQEGPGGKVLVYASRFHLSKTPVKIAMLGDYYQQVAGTYLGQRLGKRLVTIGNLAGSGKFRNGDAEDAVLEPAGPDTLDGLASETGLGQFLLDLRAAPANVRPWLAQERALGGGFHLDVSRAFDVLLYINTVTPA